MWVQRDYFPLHFLSLLFSLLNQTVENVIFHPIFLSLFSIPLFSPQPNKLLRSKYNFEEVWGSKYNFGKGLYAGGLFSLFIFKLDSRGKFDFWVWKDFRLGLNFDVGLTYFV